VIDVALLARQPDSRDQSLIILDGKFRHEAELDRFPRELSQHFVATGPISR
jgi:hypothetical protein